MEIMSTSILKMLIKIHNCETLQKCFTEEEKKMKNEV